MTNKLSTVAWRQMHPIYLSIQRHHFNQNLRDGSLSPVTFKRFLKQDVYYLRNLARCMGLIGRKAGSDGFFFLSYEDDGFKDELDFIHHYFLQDDCSHAHITAATRDYTDFLLRTASREPVEIAIASVLPCFWLFKELGVWMNSTMPSILNHPHERWIETYSDENFSDSVDHLIRVFDEVASFAPKAIQERMIATSIKSAQLEWRFINEVYHPSHHSLSLFKKGSSTVGATAQNIVQVK